MNKSSLIFATLALFCFTASFAQNNGTVSVAVTNTTFMNGQSPDSQREFVEFDYETVEWNNENENLESEWAYEEAGVGEFELTNQFGDVILIKAHNDTNNSDDDLAAILGTVVGSSALGGVSTVADNIGNSVSVAQQRLQNASVNNVTSTVVSNVENVTNHAGAIIGTVVQDVQNLPESATQAVQNVTSFAGSEVANAANSVENVYNNAANEVANIPENAAQAVENASESVQNSYNNAASSAQSTYNEAASNVNNLQENASEAVSSAATNARSNVNNAAGNLSNGLQNAATNANNLGQQAANSGTESYNNAANSAANGVNSAQNGLNNLGNAYNQGFRGVNTQQ